MDSIIGNMEKLKENLNKAKDNSTRMVEIEEHKLAALGDLVTVAYGLDKSLHEMMKTLKEIAEAQDESIVQLENINNNFDKLYREYRTK